MMFKQSENTPLVPREVGDGKSEPTEVKPESDKCTFLGQDSDIDFRMRPNRDDLTKTNRAEDSSISSICHICKRAFKGVRGLHIHQGKSKCGRSASDSTRCLPITGSNSGPLTSQVQPHSAKSRQENGYEVEILNRIPNRKAIKWPRMNDKKWELLDKAASAQLCEVGSVGKRINILENVIYEEGVKLFGVVENVKLKTLNSRRMKVIRDIRKEMKSLKSAIKKTSEEEQIAALECLLDVSKGRLKAYRSAENNRKRRWRRKNMRKRFALDPFKTCRAVLKPTESVSLEISKEDLDKYMDEVCEDPLRETNLGDIDLPVIDDNIQAFNTRKFSENELNCILRNKRNGSTPGPNKIPYKVYKKCPQLKHLLFNIICEVLRLKKSPLKWNISSNIFIQKIDHPGKSAVADFRQIALMNVEGKLFWSLVAKRVYNYLVVKNKFIDTSCQKGSIQKMAGVLEHSSLVWSGLKDARIQRRSLAIIWLDVKNAYGSVPHKLIEFALRRYMVPEDWIKLLMWYYDHLWARSSSNGVMSKWCKYQRGIFAGCTVSVILFLAAFNVILEYVQVVDVPRYKLANGNMLPVTRGFMDDVSIMSDSVKSTQVALSRILVILKWSRMNLQPAKSRSCVIIRGRCMDVEPFCVGDEVIPNIQRKPVKTLGRVIDGSLSDRKAKDVIRDQMMKGLKMIDGSLLTGIMKVWTYQNLLLPQLGWPLMVYEIPISFVENLEPKISMYLRKWLGVSKNLCSVALFCKESPAPLPLSSIVSEFKKRKVGALMQLQQSSDDNVCKNVPLLYTGRSWKAGEAIKVAESKIKLDTISGKRQVGRAGIGFSIGKEKKCSHEKNKRAQISAAIMTLESEKLLSTAVQQRLQGQWVRWQSIVQKDMRWNTLLRSSPQLISFCLGATYNTIASEKNLKRWGLADSDLCFLCDKECCDVTHVLSGCHYSLSNGRYKYRHDAVLRCIASGLQSQINSNQKVTVSSSNHIAFVKAGEIVTQKKKAASGILNESDDWIMEVDIKRQLVFPNHIVATNLRPDIVIYSNRQKKVIVIELTCPCEENIEAWHINKLSKYEELMSLCTTVGWKPHCFAVEVGARGFAGTSLQSCLRSLGVKGKNLRCLVQNCADASLRASFWIWLKRKDKSASFEQPEKRLRQRQSAEGVRKQHIMQRSAVVNNSLFCRKVNAISDRQEEFDLGVSRGLVNLGNTCYMNAILQCLKRIKAVPTLSDSVLYKGYMQVIKALECKSKNPFSPKVFKSQVSKHIPGFRDNGPKDAPEFCGRLMESLHFRDMLGTFRVTLICNNCKISLIKEETFNILQLYPPNSGTLPCTIQDCLKQFLEVEVIDDSWKCSNCNCIASATKIVSFSKLPDKLVIQIMRFSVNQNGTICKQDTFVDFPLSDWKVKNKSYVLNSLVNHLGSPISGHYTATVSEKGSRWFNFSDSKVVHLNQNEIVSNLAYLLFYENIV